MTCPDCHATIPEVEQNLGVCPSCRTILSQSAAIPGEIPLKKMFVVIAAVFFSMLFVGSLVTIYLLNTAGR